MPYISITNATLKSHRAAKIMTSLKMKLDIAQMMAICRTVTRKKTRATLIAEKTPTVDILIVTALVVNR